MANVTVHKVLEHLARFFVGEDLDRKRRTQICVREDQVAEDLHAENTLEIMKYYSAVFYNEIMNNHLWFHEINPCE